MLCVTDGASAENPSLAGSGVVLIFGKSNNNIIKFAAAIGNATNNIAELMAIGLSLVIINDNPTAIEYTNILSQYSNNNNQLIINIITDSKYSVSVLCDNNNYNKNTELVIWIKSEIQTLLQSNIILKCHWTGGHCKIPLNGMADDLAKCGANGSRNGITTDVRIRLDIQISNCLQLEINNDISSH